MPGIRKLFQESENSAKPQYIYGHMFGGLGILAGNPGNQACVSLSVRLHDGFRSLMHGKGFPFLQLALKTLNVLNYSGTVRLYSYYFRIECTFQELKRRIGAFCYHFWSKRTPKLSYYQEVVETGPLEQVRVVRCQRNILKATQATELYIAIAVLCTAMGILQDISVCSVGKRTSGQIRYQRTPSQGKVSAVEKQSCRCPGYCAPKRKKSSLI